MTRTISFLKVIKTENNLGVNSFNFYKIFSNIFSSILSRRDKGTKGQRDKGTKY